MGIRTFHHDDAEPLLKVISSDARLLAWPGNGALVANMNFVVLQPGEANLRHVHEESEDTIYIVEGKGTVLDFDNGALLKFEAGDVIHVAVGVAHAVRADRGTRVVSVGGPCPPDMHMLRAAGLAPPLPDESKGGASSD